MEHGQGYLALHPTLENLEAREEDATLGMAQSYDDYALWRCAARHGTSHSRRHWHEHDREATRLDSRERGAQGVEGREVRETRDMSILLFISGVILGLSLGLLGYRVLKGWRGRQERQRNIDQLTEQFQALFREIDSGKNPYP
jgi:hypothetical protein